jgi:signal transduction histidine kinase
VKVLLGGKRGPLLETIASALPRRAAFEVKVAPTGSRLLDLAQTPSFEALVFVLSNEEEIEPVRWILQRNRALLLLAVLPRADLKLKALLLEEGVEEVIDLEGLSGAQLGRKLRETLERIRSQPRGSRGRKPGILIDLHTIRSALTAIQGNAEMALQSAPAAQRSDKQLQEIVRGVAEIEKILRRVERGLKVPVSARGNARPVPLR